MTLSVLELCQQQEITLAQLIERTGLEEDRLVAILLGRWTPSPTERQQVATVLGTTVHEISWGHKTPVQHLYGHGPGGQTNDSLRKL